MAETDIHLGWWQVTPAEQPTSELVQAWRGREWDTFTYATIRRMADEWSAIGDRLADALQAAEMEVSQYKQLWQDTTVLAQAAEREREILLADDEVCACLDETGERKVRIYERCERCHALSRSDLPERLDSCLTERDGALEDAELFLCERDEAREQLGDAYAALAAAEEKLARAQRDLVDSSRREHELDHENEEMEERERRLREALEEIESELRFRASRSDGRGGLDPPYTPPSLLSMADLARAALADAGSSQEDGE